MNEIIANMQLALGGDLKWVIAGIVFLVIAGLSMIAKGEQELEWVQRADRD